MQKKWSQWLLTIAAGWQIVDGIITIALGLFSPNAIPELTGYAQHLPVGNITGMVGTAFLLSGLVNLLLAWYYLRRPKVGRSIPWIVFGEGLLAYACLDIISVVLLLPALVIILIWRQQSARTGKLI